MLGLNVYSFIEDTDITFYRAQRSLAKKMDVLDWLPGSYRESLMDGEGDPLDRARRNLANPVALVSYEPPLVMLHPGGPSGLADDREEEEEEDEAAMDEGVERLDTNVGFTGHTQQSEAPRRKKALQTGTPQSKLVPDLTVDDARDMYARDATAAFRDRRRGKGKKLYSDYAPEETIAISSKDEDDREMAKRLRSDPPSPTAFAGLIRVKPETLTVEEANERRQREEEHRRRMERASAEETSVKEEVAQLKALLLSRERERAQPQIDQAALITSVIQGMLSQGLMLAPSTSFPHLPPGFPPQQFPQQQPQQFPPPPLQPFAQHAHPRPYAYPPVQQDDDPRMWGPAGGRNSSSPPPPGVTVTSPPRHQGDDPSMFRAVARNLDVPHPAERGASPNHGVDARASGEQFRAVDRNHPPHAAGPVPSPPANEAHASPLGDRMDVDAEGPQGSGDASTPHTVDEPMHDAHAETGVGLRPDPHPVQEQGAVSGAVPAPEGVVKPPAAEASVASRHDRDEVIP